ncbi:MAG: trigger factor [Bacillales bacterium]|jgi:trigger factor|nr:trigger factor [Bacillales bacterium]
MKIELNQHPEYLETLLGVVTYSEEDVKPLEPQAIEDATKKIIPTLKVPGFRQGHVPFNVAQKYVNGEAYSRALVNLMMNNGLQELLKAHPEVALIARPDADIKEQKEGDTETVIEYILIPKPTIKLGEYTGLNIPKDATIVGDDEVNKEISKLLQDQITRRSVERGLVKGDHAIINYVGTKEGVAFAGGSAEEFDLLIGSGQFIPGFEDGLLGMLPGDKRDVELTFPEDYQAEELKGAKVVFATELVRVEEESTPDLTDELVLSLGLESKTVNELKQSIYDRLEKTKIEEVESKAFDNLLATILEKSTLPISEYLVKQEADKMVENYKKRIKEQYKIEFDLFLQYSGYSLEKLLEDAHLQAKKTIQNVFIIGEIAKKEEIKPTDEDISKLKEVYYTKYPKQKKEINESFKKNREHYVDEIINSKVFDYLKLNNTF